MSAHVRIFVFVFLAQAMLLVPSSVGLKASDVHKAYARFDLSEVPEIDFSYGPGLDLFEPRPKGLWYQVADLSLKLGIKTEWAITILLNHNLPDYIYWEPIPE